MNLFSKIIWLVFALIFAGCSKDDFDANSPSGLVAEITNGEGETISRYSYNKKQQVTESWHTDIAFPHNEKQHYSYIYDNSNKLTGKKGYEPGIIYMSSMTGASGKDVDYQYSYDEKGRLKSIKVDYDYDIEGWVNADYSRLSTFEYSDDKLVTMTVSTIDPAGNSIPGYSKYYYNDKGNIAKTTDNVIIDNKERIISQAVFTYDTMKAPRYPDPGPVSKSNVLTRTETSYNYNEAEIMSVAYTSVFQYEYTYNDYGYPLTQVETYPNEIKNSKQFKYVKQ